MSHPQPTTTSPSVAAFDPHNIPLAVDSPIVPIAGEPPVGLVVAGLVITKVIGISTVLFIIFLMWVNNWNLINWWT